MKSNWRWLLLILVVVSLFFWKLILTSQFSLLVWSEASNQAYSWYHFSAASVQQGTIPLWDPYSHAGRSFVGGMETGAFYPLKAIVYLWPFSRSGLFSQRAYHYYYVLSHILAACFLFFLARELGLSVFPSFSASLCFSLAGFMANIAWPDMLDSAIWLPLIMLFLARALRSSQKAQVIVLSCIAGLLLGLSVLGGRIHIVIMDAMVIVSVTIYMTWQRVRAENDRRIRKSFWLRGIVIISAIAAISIMFGAVQLVPAFELSDLAIRYIGSNAPPPAMQKIAYYDLHGGLWPRALFALLIGQPFANSRIGEEDFGPHFGFLPFLLAMIGVWRNWHNPWVRYLAGLSVLAFFYSIGSYSFLHGILYAIVPYLWVAREAARITYLMHFATALLVGFGIQTLFETQTTQDNFLARFTYVLWWFVAIVTGILLIPALYGKPDVNEWIYYSMLFILSGVAIISYISRAHRTWAMAIVLVAVILSEFHGNYWIIRNIKMAIHGSEDYLHGTLLKSRDLANFLKSQQGIFRVHMDAEIPPNIGDLYGIQTIQSTMATELRDFYRFRNEVSNRLDLLNVRFIVKRNSATDPNPVYQDGLWKVYENNSYLPRAWIVRETIYASTQDEAIQQMNAAGFEPRRQAIVAGRLESGMEPQTNSVDTIKIDSYQAQRIELSVQADAPGLLVLSEIYYPGWEATLNGAPVSVYKANGLMRSVIVPAGKSKIIFRYAPRSIRVGAAITCLALLVTIGIAFYARRRKTKTSDANALGF